jgi:hypothetical protein
LNREIALFARNRGRRDAAAETRRRIHRKTAPAGADLEHVIGWLQLELAADALEPRELRLPDAVSISVRFVVSSADVMLASPFRRLYVGCTPLDAVAAYGHGPVAIEEKSIDKRLRKNEQLKK